MYVLSSIYYQACIIKHVLSSMYVFRHVCIIKHVCFQACMYLLRMFYQA
jgi:hypothetical protein